MTDTPPTQPEAEAEAPPLTPAPPSSKMVPLEVEDQMGNKYQLFAFPSPPFGVMETFRQFSSAEDPMSQVDAINQLMTMAFPPDVAEQLANLNRMPGGPSMDQMMSLFEGLMEAWFRRPTGGSSESSPSDGPMSFGSEGTSSPKAATPPPLPPSIG